MRNSSIRTSLTVAGVVLLAAGAATVSAATVSRTISQNAPGLCSANNPANQQYLRNLLGGLKNATTVSVSVVCSKVGDDQTVNAMNSAFVYFKNEKATSGTVTCTLAAGSPFYGQTNYTRSATIGGGGTGSIFWDTTDYGSSNHNQWVNIQCSLPAGWVMREVGSLFDENVGA
jgi:hypothetical protein